MDVVDEKFNPLRFIALHLKELNEDAKSAQNTMNTGENEF